MCAVSMVADHYTRKWDRWIPPRDMIPGHITINDGPTKADFEELKKEVRDLKELIIAAKKYDEENNQPDCENDEKFDKLRKIADLVGIDLDDVL